MKRRRDEPRDTQERPGNYFAIFGSDEATEELSLQGAVGNRAYIGASLSLLGNLQTVRGHPREALDTLREGEALLRATDNPFELAELLCVKGRAAIASGDPVPEGLRQRERGARRHCRIHQLVQRAAASFAPGAVHAR